MMLVHGTAVALAGAGVLMRGPSGSGKSDLALRLVEGGALLVADDQTELWPTEGAVLLRAPTILAGRLEVRGLGILRMPSIAEAPLKLVLELVAPERVERLPDPEFCQYFQCDIPLLRLAPFEISAASKVRLALRGLVAPTAGPILAGS